MKDDEYILISLLSMQKFTNQNFLFMAILATCLLQSCCHDTAKLDIKQKKICRSIPVDDEINGDQNHQKILHEHDGAVMLQSNLGVDEENQLPIEILFHIISFLDGKDFIRASCIAKDWRNAAISFLNFNGHVMINLSNQKMNKNYLILRYLCCSGLNLSNCQLNNKAIDQFLGDNKDVELRKKKSFTRQLKDLFYGTNNSSHEVPVADHFLYTNTSFIKTLDLSNNRIGSEGVKIIAQSKFDQLTALNLSNNRIDNTGLRALLMGNFCHLVKLNLSKNQISKVGTKSFADSHLTSLTYLNLANNMEVNATRLVGTTIEDEGFVAILSGNLPKLTYLNLKNSRISDLGVRNALKNIHKINTLILSKNKHITDYGMQLLLSDSLSNLTSLNVSDCSTTGIGIQFILKSITLKNLKKIKLSGDFTFRRYALVNYGLLNMTDLVNQITDLEITNSKSDILLNHIIKNYCPFLTRLSMRFCGISNTLLQIFSNSNLLLHLTYLDFSFNHIKNGGLVALAHIETFSTLTYLNLANNKIANRGVKALAYSNFTKLEELNLSQNYITDQGAIALANGNLTALKKLNLKNNLIVNKG